MYCDLFLWENFWKVFGSGQSDMCSGNSMTICTSCYVVNVNNVHNYMLIQLDNSKHCSSISRLSEGRKIHVLSCNIDYPDPLSPCLRTVMVTKNSDPGGFSVEKVGRNNCDEDWKNANLLFKRRSRRHRAVGS